MAQSAVRWLEENINEYNWEQAFELAKQMEKKQMIDVYTNAKNTWDGKSLTTLLKEYNENELSYRLH
jgi:hypothetical protein